jgi:tRNA modification GTPase
MSNSAQEETIVAVSTPPGRGAISIIRLSGSAALDIATAVFKPRAKAQSLTPGTAVLGRIMTADNETIDEVIVTYFQSPHSFTGEDVVEISCHGNPVLMGAILERLLKRGARLAQPGDFTLRAFLNGKMDLAQTEGLRDLIDAKTRRQADIARRQMEGSLSKRLTPIKEQITQTIVQLETFVEFVEEQPRPQDRATIGAILRGIACELDGLSGSFTRGILLREGWSVAIVGRPNVGKSSIFNKIIDYDRAIVTELPGTTRDPLRETIEMQGIPITLIDTAGLREPRNVVEREGIRRSHSELADAHLVLFVLDARHGWTAGDQRIWQQLHGRRVVVAWNKVDLQLKDVHHNDVAALKEYTSCCVSALTGQGIEELRQTLVETGLPEQLADDDLLIASIRHRDCLERTGRAIQAAADALAAGLSEEFAVIDLRTALTSLGEITGETMIEDIIKQIFSQFCVGK